MKIPINYSYVECSRLQERVCVCVHFFPLNTLRFHFIYIFGPLSFFFPFNGALPTLPFRKLAFSLLKPRNTFECASFLSFFFLLTYFSVLSFQYIFCQLFSNDAKRNLSLRQTKFSLFSPRYYFRPSSCWSLVEYVCSSLLFCFFLTLS